MLMRIQNASALVVERRNKDKKRRHRVLVTCEDLHTHEPIYFTAPCPGYLRSLMQFFFYELGRSPKGFYYVRDNFTDWPVVKIQGLFKEFHLAAMPSSPSLLNEAGRGALKDMLKFLETGVTLDPDELRKYEDAMEEMKTYQVIKDL